MRIYTRQGHKFACQNFILTGESKTFALLKSLICPLAQYIDLMIFVGAGLVPAHNGGKHKALPLQNANDFLIGINYFLIGINFIEKGLEQGRQAEKQAMALTMLQKGLDLAFISEVTGLTLEELQ